MRRVLFSCLFIIAVVLFGTLALMPCAVSLAQTDSVSILMDSDIIDAVYGSLLTGGDFEGSTTSGRVYGNVGTDHVFTFSQDGDYYFSLDQIQVAPSSIASPTPDDVRPLTVGGFVQVNHGNYRWQLTSQYKIEVYSSVDGTLAYYADTYTGNVSSGVTFVVARREIVVSLDVAHSAQVANVFADTPSYVAPSTREATIDEQSAIVIAHPYATPAASLQFAVAPTSGYGMAFNDTLQYSASFSGNGPAYPLGMYSISDELSLTIVDEHGVDQSANYICTPDHAYYIEVVPFLYQFSYQEEVRINDAAPALVTADSIEIQRHYEALDTPQAGSMAQLYAAALRASTGYQATPYIQRITLAKPEGDGQIAVYLDIDTSNPHVYEYLDKRIIALNQAGTPYEDGWALSPVAIELMLDGATVIAVPHEGGFAYQNEGVWVPIGYAAGIHLTQPLRMRILPRTVTVYLSNGINQPTGDSIALNPADLTAAYGALYNTEPKYVDILLDGSNAGTLSFTISDIENYMEGGASVMLDCNTYAITNAQIEDIHYIVTVDSSVTWTITPKVLTPESVSAFITPGTLLPASADFIAATGAAPGAYCLEERTYSPSATAHSRTLTLWDSVLMAGVTAAEQPDKAVSIELSLSAPTRPGYYAYTVLPVASGSHSANYRLADGIVFYLRVLPIAMGMQADDLSLVYDGGSHTAPLYFNEVSFGELFGVLEGELQAAWDVRWSVRYGTSSSAKDAGNYPVGITVNQSPYFFEGYISTPYFLVPEGAKMVIAPKPVTITITAKKPSKVFGESVKLSDVCTSQITGLVGSDKIEITSDGLSADAKPAKYVYAYRFKTGKDTNYKVTINRVELQVKKVDGSVLESQGITPILQINTGKDTISIAFYYQGIALTSGIRYEYQMLNEEGESEWLSTSDSITDLLDGTAYRVRAVIGKTSKEISVSDTFYTAYGTINTPLIMPAFEQVDEYTSSTDIVILPAETGPRYLYSVGILTQSEYEEDDSLFDERMTIVEPMRNEEGEFVGYSMAQTYATTLAPGSVYYIMLQRYSTIDGISPVYSEVVAMHTRASSPDVKYDDLVISYDSVDIPAGCAYCIIPDRNASAVTAVTSTITSQISMAEAGITYADIQAYQESLASGEALTHDRLSPLTNYVLVLIYPGDETIDSEAICLRFRTPIDPANIHQYEGIELYISQYFLVGGAGLMLLLWWVCMFVFIGKKKKLRGGRR